MGTDPVTKSVGKVLSSVLPKSVMPKKFTLVHLVVVVVVVIMLYHALTDNVEGLVLDLSNLDGAASANPKIKKGMCSAPTKEIAQWKKEIDDGKWGNSVFEFIRQNKSQPNMKGGTINANIKTNIKGSDPTQCTGTSAASCEENNILPWLGSGVIGAKENVELDAAGVGELKCKWVALKDEYTTPQSYRDTLCKFKDGSATANTALCSDSITSKIKFSTGEVTQNLDEWIGDLGPAQEWKNNFELCRKEGDKKAQRANYQFTWNDETGAPKCDTEVRQKHMLVGSQKVYNSSNGKPNWGIPYEYWKSGCTSGVKGGGKTAVCTCSEKNIDANCNAHAAAWKSSHGEGILNTIHGLWEKSDAEKCKAERERAHHLFTNSNECGLGTSPHADNPIADGHKMVTAGVLKAAETLLPG